MGVIDSRQLEEFSQTALRTRSSISLPVRMVYDLVFELQCRVEEKGTISEEQAHEKTRSCLKIKCEQCGMIWSRDYLRLAELAEADIRGVLRSSINFRQLYSGRCPTCKGTSVLVTFDPSLLSKRWWQFWK